MPTRRCPICRSLFDPEKSPSNLFCGERCRLLDLGRWLDERYGLPDESDESPETSDAEPEPE
ncbi:MAG: DNA gyrase inhibitor YacG [Pirellulaceae bacterium]|nr:DNA gyrase inhibitor YacG [Pirellulaceae bacterium]